MHIDGAVNKILKKYGTLDIDKLCDKMGIILLNVKLPKNTRGFFQKFKRINVIYLNYNLNENERRLVIAHEIAHAILHGNLNRIFMDNHTLNKTNKYENEANLLASYMLISDDDICEYIDYQYTYSQISSITGIDEKILQQRTQLYFSQNELLN